MPFQKSDDKLDELIKQAIEDPADLEIREGIKQARLGTSELYAEIKRAPDEIWDSVRDGIARFDDEELQLRRVRQQINEELGAKPASPSTAEPPGWVMGSGCLGPLLLLLGAFLFFTRGETWRAVFTASRNLLWLLGVFGSLMAFGGLMAWSESRVRRRLEKGETDWKETKAKLEERLSVHSQADSVHYAQEFVEKAVLEKKIKPRLREFINSRLTPSFSIQLGIAEAKGLAEVFDPQMAIDTSARTSLRFLLENMPGGSIGIAGPRGAGKSTLLRLFCGPKRILSELKGKPVLSVLVSAPDASRILCKRSSLVFGRLLFILICQQQ